MHTILLVVTGTGAFAGGKPATGLWLSECTHIYRRAEECGCEVTVASPEGGDTPVDPESLKPLLLDKISEQCWKNPAFREVLHRTERLEDVCGQRFDCIYLAGGHGAMFDFPENAALQELVKQHYESGRIVAAICHGVCGLLDVRLSDGSYLLHGRDITGFSRQEEWVARRERVIPFDLEASLKERGAHYRKAFLPMTSKVVVDRNLITGQNPFSSKKMAEAVLQR